MTPSPRDQSERVEQTIGFRRLFSADRRPDLFLHRPGRQLGMIFL
jgi:hypothetical protein